MRLIVLIGLVVAVTADISGYNYNRLTHAEQRSQPIHHQQQQQQQQRHQQQQSQPIVEEVNKEFYTYSAPEEEFEVEIPEQQGQSASKRNLQVIFIRSPEQNHLNRAVQHIAQQNLEQQTAIYVLTRQPDLSQLTQSIQQDNNHVVHKPEVHFVKYRTAEDADRAQQTIRAQYDALGGSSSHSDGGVAPVLNFASHSAPNGHSHGAVAGHSHQQAASAQAPSSNYLPIRF